MSDVFDKRSILLHLESKTKEAAFMELIEAMAAVHPELDKDEMLSAVQDRESKMNTLVTAGAAVPHGYYPGMSTITGAIGISEDGIDYDTPDHKPANYIFLIVMGEGCREKHLRVLNQVASLIGSGALAHVKAAKSPEELYDLLSRFN